jgi:hypothetical protein
MSSLVIQRTPNISTGWMKRVYMERAPHISLPRVFFFFSICCWIYDAFLLATGRRRRRRLVAGEIAQLRPMRNTFR